jgi:hypothetical protein
VTGVVEKATNKTGLRVRGVNKDACVANGTLEVYSGIFLMDNDTTHPMSAVHVGSHAACFVKDEHTVAHEVANNYNLVAGDVVDVVADGVWVYVGHDSGT